MHNEKITNNLLEVFENSKPYKILVASSSCVFKDNGPDLISERYLFDQEPEIVNRGYGWAQRFLITETLVTSIKLAI